MTPGPGIGRTLLPDGFVCSGVNSGVRRYRPDLGIIISEIPMVVAGVFTQNQCKAAPILYCQDLLPSDQIRAVIVNSGQANAATGEKGLQDNLKMAQAAAQAIGCEPRQVLTSSTGAIGMPMEIGKIMDSVPELVERCGHTAEAFALAILTTDLVPKTVATTIELSSGAVQLTGICKGSGMIHPNMGTMLGYFLTDARLTQEQAAKLLKTSTDKSFNMISVDGDCSTNDCAFLMANGASDVGLMNDKDFERFQRALDEVSIFLAKAIARDGEGATKLIEVRLKGAPDEGLAKHAARGLILSPLVKTAIHGANPNWGRILARLGADGVPAATLDRLSLKIQGELIFENGAPVKADLSTIGSKLKSDIVEIDIDLKSGVCTATAWGCDLSKKYVEINAEYLT